MSKLLLSILALSLLAGCVSSATPRPRLPTDAEVEQYNALAPEEDHVACITRIELGSRSPRRSCYRVADLEAQKNQGQSVVDLMQIDGLLDSPFGLQ